MHLKEETINFLMEGKNCPKKLHLKEETIKRRRQLRVKSGKRTHQLADFGLVVRCLENLINSCHVIIMATIDVIIKITTTVTVIAICYCC